MSKIIDTLERQLTDASSWGDDLREPIAAIRAVLCGPLEQKIADLTQCWHDEQQSHGKTIDERDEAEGAFQDLVASFGVNPDLSSTRGYDDMMADCAEVKASLEKRIVELTSERLFCNMCGHPLRHHEPNPEDHDCAWCNDLDDARAEGRKAGLEEAAKKAREIGDGGIGRIPALTAVELERMARTVR